jgi:EXS family
MVRPTQDIAFTVCYLLFGLRGWWSDHYIENTVTSMNLTTTAMNQYVDEWSNVTSAMWSGGSSTSTSIGNNIGHSFLQAADARVPVMERSWILHTAILPACMISPLWWRFLQTLRQCYDTKQRWPYLGNAFKYFFAAQVAMIGVYHPSRQNNLSWIFSFVVATLYQVCV